MILSVWREAVGVKTLQSSDVPRKVLAGAFQAVDVSLSPILRKCGP